MLSSSTFWLVAVLVGVGTFALRASFIYLLGSLEVSETTARALRLVPAGVLAALIVPTLLFLPQTSDLSLWHPRLVAGLAAILVAWYTKNVLLTLITGMGVLWALQALGWT